MSEIARVIVEPLTLALALSLGVFGAGAGWHAHEGAMSARTRAPQAAEDYVDALCRNDVAYLLRKTGEAAGLMPWEPRRSRWAETCTGHRYLGASLDRIGREEHVFALLQSDGTEVLYIVTFGRDGLVAGID